MDIVRLNAYAKLNLTLDITGRSGGYHMLDSLAVTVDLFDRIVVKKRRDALVSVAMHGLGSESIPPEENHAQRAGERFVAQFQTTGADITVYKNIPIGAGMGGSSADAAGVLNAMARLYAIRDRAALKQLADETGSDTGYLLEGGFARMQGRGEQVTQFPSCPRLFFLVLVPPHGVSTTECYRLYDTLPQNQDICTQQVLDHLLQGRTAEGAACMRNALFPAARTLNSAVAGAAQALASFSPLGCSMTGSGSAVFALFETRELCDWARSRYRGPCRAMTLASVLPAEAQGAGFWRNPFVLGEEE